MVDDLYARYGDEIEARNRLDTELYRHVEEYILPRFESEYGEAFQYDFGRFQSDLATAREPVLRRRLDYIFRKSYVEPVGNLIRMLNGLPASGSY
jgi:hypothetical protein